MGNSLKLLMKPFTSGAYGEVPGRPCGHRVKRPAMPPKDARNAWSLAVWFASIGGNSNDTFHLAPGRSTVCTDRFNGEVKVSVLDWSPHVALDGTRSAGQSSSGIPISVPVAEAHPRGRSSA
ncbi:hypothetical protein D3C81_1682090 [compost metagenome]